MDLSPTDRATPAGDLPRLRSDPGGGEAGPSDNKAKSVYGFMLDATDLGVKLYACGGALQAYAITANLLIPECTGIAGAAAYINRVLDDQWRSITY